MEANTTDYKTMYESMSCDFKNMKARLETERDEAERNSENDTFVNVIMPLYQDLMRAFENTANRDILYAIEFIHTKMREHGYAVMNKMFLDKFFLTLPNNKRPDIGDIANVIHTKVTHNKNEHGLVDSIFAYGLYDLNRSKILLFPKVSIKVYE
jgi:hypothetical protein